MVNITIRDESDNITYALTKSTSQKALENLLKGFPRGKYKCSWSQTINGKKRPVNKSIYIYGNTPNFLTPSSFSGFQHPENPILERLDELEKKIDSQEDFNDDLETEDEKSDIKIKLLELLSSEKGIELAGAFFGDNEKLVNFIKENGDWLKLQIISIATQIGLKK